jgi:hypothetical protein
MRSDGNKPSANAAMIVFRYTGDSSGRNLPITALDKYTTATFQPGKFATYYANVCYELGPNLVD